MIAQHMIFQFRWSGDMSSVRISSEITRVGQFMRPNPLTFMGTKVKKNLPRFIDKIEKIFKIMRASVTRGGICNLSAKEHC